MSEIKAGDWVTINCCGPYEVDTTDMADAPSLVRLGHGPRVYIGGTVRLWVDPYWCEKVPPPFDPEIGSLWQDREDNVWQCVRLEISPGVLGTLMHRLIDNMQTNPSKANDLYGPFTQLVPKEENDE